MKIIVTTKKPVLTQERGRLPAGVPVEVSPLLAAFLIERGEAQAVETKAPDPEAPRRGRPPRVKESA